jgi:hypothetical protein
MKIYTFIGCHNDQVIVCRSIKNNKNTSYEHAWIEKNSGIVNHSTSKRLSNQVPKDLKAVQHYQLLFV